MTSWNVGIAGLADPRVGTRIQQWRDCPDAAVVASCDPDASARAHARSTYDLDRVSTTWEEMLSDRDIHLLHVALSGEERALLVEEAAERGIHCLVEPPMAGSLDQADRMLSAARRNGIRLVVGWQAAWNPAVVHARALVEDELVGPVLQIWQRTSLPQAAWLTAGGATGANATGGVRGTEACAPGALAECASHGINLCRVLIGVPTACTAVLTHVVRQDPGQDDSAIAILSYGSAIGICEASWLDAVRDSAPDAIIRGASGTLTLMGNTLRLQKAGNPAGMDCAVPPLPEWKRNGPETLLGCVIFDRDPEGFCNPQVGRDVQEILEACRISDSTGRTVRLPLR